MPAAERKVEDRIQIFELLARTLTRIAGGKPLVLILENLHGAEISIEALQYIVRRLGPTPTLIVGSYRQTETDKRHPLIAHARLLRGRPALRLADAAAVLPLRAPLARRVARRRRRRSPTGWRSGCTTRPRAIPFFTKELIRSLVESGDIARDDTGAWSFSTEAEISADALPATIQQAVEKRIERLPEELRDLLSIASVLGKTFDARDLETLAEDAQGVDDSIDRLILEGILEEDRESRGDRLTFASGIVRDVLYAALSRRRRRSLHRKYAELIEKRSAGRLERVYPELVHHYSQGDVPEKTVEYGLKLAQKSLDTFSPEEAIRVAKIALEFLEDEEWSGDPALEGEARLMLAQGQRMTGNVDAALREAEAAVRVFEESRRPGPRRGRDPLRRRDRLAGAADRRRAPLGRARHRDGARRRRRPTPCPSSSSLGATVANLRGEYAQAAAYQAEIEHARRRASRPAEEEIPRGGTLVVAMPNPVAATEPARLRHHRGARGPGQRLRDARHDRCAGQPRAATSASAGRSRTAARRCASTCARASSSPTERPLTAARRQGLARALDPPVARRDAGGLRRHPRRRRSSSTAARADVAGIRALADREVEHPPARPAPDLPVAPDRRADRDRRRRAPKPAEARRSGPGPFRVALARAGPRRPRAQPAVLRESPARASTASSSAPRSSPSAIAEGLRSGQLDIARDLLPQDLEARPARAALPRRPRRDAEEEHLLRRLQLGERRRLERGPADSRSPGVARTQDFVWGALGRFALPATGLIPPGILGHDPGRRQPHLSQGEGARDDPLGRPAAARAAARRASTRSSRTSTPR